MKKYLPIGSVVLLKDSNKRLMIYGRNQLLNGEGQPYDYIGCLFPEGHIDANHAYLFNHDQIQKVYLVGFTDVEEIIYSETFLSGRV